MEMDEQNVMIAPSRTISSEYMHWAKTHGDVLYNLANSGVPDYPLNEIPFSNEDLVLTGAGSYGSQPLLQTIASRYNVPVDSVVTTLGASMANFLVMALTLQPGDEVLIEHPTYELLLSAARFLGASVKRFHRKFEEGFQVNINELEQTITPKTRLIVLTNLHNPSSAFTDEIRMKQIGEAARSVGARIMVGEIYLPTMFDRKPFSALDFGNEFITTNSLTKTYGLSGLRLGWILAEPDIAQKLWRLIDLFYANHVTLSEKLGIRAFQHIEAMATRSKTMLDANRLVFNKFLKEHNEIECSKSEYGTIVFPRLKKGNVERFIENLRTNHQTLVTPGSFFEMPDHFRMGLGVKPEIFSAGLERIGLALKS